MLQIGQSLPDVKLRRVGAGGPQEVSTRELFAGKKAVLFAVPGAFTPTCSDVHLPGFLARLDDLKAKGVELIACTAVNDAHVLAAWAKDRGIGERIVLLADGNGELPRAAGLELDLSAIGFGKRSKRYAAIVENGVVRYLGVENAPGVTASSADAVLAAL
jgi:glutaredoxin/glutathione-dependent peroxiredoxin